MSDPPILDNETRDDEAPSSSSGHVSLDRSASFLLVFGAIMLFLSFYLATVQFVGEHLQLRFAQIVSESIRVAPSRRPPGETIRAQLLENVENSEWVRFWGVKVDITVLGRDNQTWLYVNGRVPTLRYPDRELETRVKVHAELLPPTATVQTAIGHNTALSNLILTSYATMLFTALFVYNRRVAHLQDRALDEAHESRDQAATNAGRIQKEIDSILSLLREVEPAKREDREEIERLQTEQQELQSRLDALAARERELRGQADRAGVLEEEGLALEELLEEATRDLDTKNEKIRDLEKSLKREQKGGASSGGKAKDSELLAKRMRTLYPDLEIDDRVINDLAALRDETIKLRAEECIKRLVEDSDIVRIRRKVGGLPNHLSIYELGFAGKRRIYYARAQNGRFRVLLLGAKNTQLSDLDYLRRIPRGEIVS